jgi:hypothetical protein
VSWVKSHAVSADFAKYGLSERDVVGNAAADALAGRGGKENALDETDWGLMRGRTWLALKRTVVAMHLAITAQHAAEAGQAEEEVTCAQVQRVKRRSAMTASGHSFEEVEHGSWRCALCFACTRPPVRASWLAAHPCPGELWRQVRTTSGQWGHFTLVFPNLLGDTIVAGRQRLDRTHTLALRGGVVWCWACGAYVAVASRKVHARLLTLPCRGTPTQSGRHALAFLRTGRPPRDFPQWPLTPEDDLCWRAGLLRAVIAARPGDVRGIGAASTAETAEEEVDLSAELDEAIARRDQQVAAVLGGGDAASDGPVLDAPEGWALSASTLQATLRAGGTTTFVLPHGGRWGVASAASSPPEEARPAPEGARGGPLPAVFAAPGPRVVEEVPGYGGEWRPPAAAVDPSIAASLRRAAAADRLARMLFGDEAMDVAEASATEARRAAPPREARAASLPPRSLTASQAARSDANRAAALARREARRPVARALSAPAAAPADSQRELSLSQLDLIEERRNAAIDRQCDLAAVRRAAEAAAAGHPS